VIFKIFKIFVGITSIPLAALAFLLSDNPRWSWLATVSLIVLFTYGLIGGICGFVIYGIMDPSSSLSAFLNRRRQATELQTARRNSGKSTRSLISTVSLIASAGAACLFVFNIVSSLNSGEKISTDTPFTVGKAGGYTLFLGQSPETLTGQFEMKRTATGEVIHSYPIWGSVELKGDIGRYYGKCNFNIPAPGTYSIVYSNGRSLGDMLLQPATTIIFIAGLLATFAMAVVFSITGCVYRFR
jgi:hypothetical protein